MEMYTSVTDYFLLLIFGDRIIELDDILTAPQYT